MTPTDRVHTAVIVIDMLDDFFRTGRLAGHRARLTTNTNALVRWSRQQGWPVIWIRQEFEPDLSDAYRHMRARNDRYTIRGTAGCELLGELEVADIDQEIIKKRYSAFFNTNLEILLRQHQVARLIVAGVTTAGCVRMTATDAYQRDYEVVLATDCVEAFTAEDHASSLHYLGNDIVTLLSNAEIQSRWKGPA